MNIIKLDNNNTLRAVVIGRRGENDVTEVDFDFSAWAEEFGSGVVSLLVKRMTDVNAYPVVLTIDGTQAKWLISSTDTAYEGRGSAEFVYTVDEQIAKSVVFCTNVLPDIGTPTPTPPDPYETWLETLTDLAADTQQNAEDAAGSASDAARAKDAAEAAAAMLTNVSASASTLQPGESATAAYSNGNFAFGIPQGATGADGFSPEVTITNITGGHRVTITDADGDHTFDVMDGATPAPELYWCTYGTTTNAQIEQALSDGKLPVLFYNANIDGNFYFPLTRRFYSTEHQFGSIYGDYTFRATCKNNSWTHGTFQFALRNSPALTGTPTAPTAASGTDTTQIATTAFVQAAVGKTETVSGSTPVIVAEPNHRYICGTVSTLDFTPASSGLCEVIFTSGSTATVLTLPANIKMPGWFSVGKNETIELNFYNGYGVASIWSN